ncbi:uncharacterized protein RSE6_11588 [Rhynchosporium secalis]|uniref:Transcription factor domain-containing protein n=1 Tax=Rhynchosporium secalis TaxID=38038 RepID=A0A1E1MNB1_RHYSE|nr:uncharacterized protein RSE6_11588 [Rhynchosporium secalis]
MAVEMKAVQYRNYSKDIQNYEFGRLWWGIVTLDRNLNQDLSPDKTHPLVGSGSDIVPAMELPVNNEAISRMPPPISMRTASGISASHQPATRLGPYCRAAEAGHILGQVLDLIAQSSYTQKLDLDKLRALDHAMQSFAMVWGLIRDEPGQETQKAVAGMALASEIRMAIDISQRFHMDLAFIYLPALPLPVTYAVYRATLLYIQFSGDGFQGPEWSLNMNSLKSTLGRFGKRWKVGEHYLDLIDIAISNEAHARARTGGQGSPTSLMGNMRLEPGN